MSENAFVFKGILRRREIDYLLSKASVTLVSTVEKIEAGSLKLQNLKDHATRLGASSHLRDFDSVNVRKE